MTEDNKQEAGFNYDEWKSQGEMALSQLRLKEESLESALKEVNEQIKGLETSLGLVKGGKKTRVRIRPAIVQCMKEEERKDAPLLIKDLIALVLLAVPQATSSSVDRAIRRLVSDTPAYSISGDLIAIDHSLLTD